MAKSTSSEAVTWTGIIIAGFVFVVYLLPRLMSALNSGQTRSAATGGLQTAQGSVYPYATGQSSQNPLASLLAALAGKGSSGGGGKSGGGGGMMGGGGSSSGGSVLQNLFGSPNAIDLGAPQFMPETYAEQTAWTNDVAAPYSPGDGGPILDTTSSSNGNPLDALSQDTSSYGDRVTLADDSSSGGANYGGNDDSSSMVEDN
ncbi:MAG TPA: hypothetical protein VMU24_02320 [Candidatus Acidoferrales bacterium]|nr:hypothetical protein [Candidatus Acidoferrales bacterium]